MGKTNAKAGRSENLPDLTSSDISDDFFEEVIADVCSTTPATTDINAKRRTETILRYLLGQDLCVAALKAGYAPSTARGAIYDAKKQMSVPGTTWNQAFLKIAGALPDNYRTLCASRLPKIAQIDDAALNLYLANPDLAIKSPAYMKQIKQSAGVLANDVDAQRAPSLVITAAQVIMGQVYQQHPTIEAPKPKTS
jgi:hypothetical protein